MTLERLGDHYSSLILWLMLSFIGFSILVWAYFERLYGLGGFGLAMILISTFVVRNTLGKQLSLVGLLGATIVAGLSVPIGYLIGQYLTIWIGYLAAAIWGGIIGTVLLLTIGRHLLRFLSMRVQNILYSVAIIVGMIFGVVRMGSRMGNLYGPIGGTIFIGWTFGMALGLIVGYRLTPDRDLVSMDT